MLALKTFNNSFIHKAFIALLYFLSLYLVFIVYNQGETLFAIALLVILSSGIYVFFNKNVYHWRYLYPGLVALGIFVVFPLVATVAIAFTNYSATNQMNFEKAVRYFTSQTYPAGSAYNFKLLQNNDKYQITVKNDNGEQFISKAFDLNSLAGEIDLKATQNLPDLKSAPLKTITQNRLKLQSLTLNLPTGQKLTMSSLRSFSELKPKFSFDKNTEILTDNSKNQRYKANNETGFFQKINDLGNFEDEILEPGFTVGVGFKNFIKIFNDEGIKQPFLQIFGWTITFALLSVIFPTALGLIFAAMMQWDALKGKAVYRLLLILPYAVPAFISILIFKGLFNQSFGEINVILKQLFGIQPPWFVDPFYAKVMLIIVNTWLGYPYLMIVAMGFMKSIPSDLYEASAIDGANPIHNFFKITLPLVIKPLTPILIANFAFNFNNFVVIQLLTEGNPSIIGTSTPAGSTDLLVSYTYRIAFQGDGSQDFGLASAIAILIFIIISILAIIQTRMTKITQD